MFEEILLKKNTVYQGSFLQVREDTVQLPDGKPAQRVVVDHPGAACVLAQTSDFKVILVQQYRYPCQEALLEIPAGKLDEGESPAACAQRELAEETPFTAESFELIYSFYTAPGFSNEKIYLYQAVNIQQNSALQADVDEWVDCVLLTRDEVKAALKEEKIQDAKTIIALQHWLHAKST